MKTALLIGNSDGIGLTTTQKLLDLGYRVLGISRRESPIKHANYSHHVMDVTHRDYKQRLISIIEKINSLHLCIYFAGVGTELNWQSLSQETETFSVNVMGAVETTEVALNYFLKQGSGHFIGLSSVVDQMISPEAPSYSASKSAVSKYWDGLGLAAKNKGIFISNVRFGFVDTKMAKAPIRPFLLTPSQAADFILTVIQRPRIRATKPLAILPLVWILRLLSNIRVLVSR